MRHLKCNTSHVKAFESPGLTGIDEDEPSMLIAIKRTRVARPESVAWSPRKCKVSLLSRVMSYWKALCSANVQQVLGFRFPSP